MADANKPTQQTELETVRSEKFFKLYANSAHIEVTAWDFSLIFGELSRRGDRTTVEQSIAITMSPQHAKAFAGILVNNIREYEKHVGEIKLPQQEAPNATPEPRIPTVTVKAQ